VSLRTYRVSTLGCRVNRADSMAIERDFALRGFRRAEPDEVPDIWVVNTCAVTAEGMRKSRKLARRCARSGAHVIVTGCGADLDPDVFNVPGVESIVANVDKDKVARQASEGDASPSPTGGAVCKWTPKELVRVPVKVQEGCNRYCTYCIVPYLRPPTSSRQIESVVEEVRELGALGAGEVILCGIDLGSYRDPVRGEGLEALARSISDECGGMWLRLSSIELSDIGPGLASAMAEGGALRRHLHVPLQSGDERVLADMGREYTPEQFAGRVRRLRELVPGLSMTTDVIVGFPTEDESAFESTARMIDEIAFSRVHVFKYSPRPKTAAVSLGDPVEPGVKEARATALRELARGTALRFHECFVGRIIQVLVEAAMESEPGRVFGRAESFAGVIFDGYPALVGRTVDVRVTDADPEGLRGVMVMVDE